jgi:hypothetical protein
MKNIIKGSLIVLVIANILGSVLLTIISICSNRYFSEYENLKSLEHKELYMSTDFLLIEDIYEDRGESINFFVVKGKLLSDNSKIKLISNRLEYLQPGFSKQPIYRSKLTGDFFLKDAPQKYYSAKIWNFYAMIYLKVSFYIIIGIAIYLTIRYFINRRYRL